MSSWRQRLSEQYGAEAEQHLSELGVDTLTDDQHESVLRAQWLESARSFEPDASLPEELLVKLSGEIIESGALDFKVGDALLKPLQEGIDALSGKGVDLEMTGISSGSTVLHVRAVPSSAPIEDENQHLARLEYPLPDVAIRQYIRVIAIAEDRLDLRQAAFALDSGIFGALDHLVDALDKYDLSLGLRWLSRNGAVSSATFTRQGRQYVRSLRDTTTRVTTRIIRGRITELREAGVARVKTATYKTAPAFDVRFERDQLLELHLELGQQVAFEVDVHEKLDKFGRQRFTEYRYIGQAYEEESEMF